MAAHRAQNTLQTRKEQESRQEPTGLRRTAPPRVRARSTEPLQLGRQGEEEEQVAEEGQQEGGEGGEGGEEEEEVAEHEEEMSEEHMFRLLLLPLVLLLLLELVLREYKRQHLPGPVVALRQWIFLCKVDLLAHQMQESEMQDPRAMIM